LLDEYNDIGTEQHMASTEGIDESDIQEHFIIREVFDQHFEELQSFLTQRQAWLSDSVLNSDDLRQREERALAHLDGLLVHGPAIIPLLEPRLAEDDSAFAAAYVLLQLGNNGISQLVARTFGDAQATQLEGIGDALCQSPIASISSKIREILDSGPTRHALAAAIVLAFHQLLPEDHERLDEFHNDEDPQIRQAAWRLTALMDAEA